MLYIESLTLTIDNKQYDVNGSSHVIPKDLDKITLNKESFNGVVHGEDCLQRGNVGQDIHPLILDYSFSDSTKQEDWNNLLTLSSLTENTESRYIIKEDATEDNDITLDISNRNDIYLKAYLRAKDEDPVQIKQIHLTKTPVKNPVTTNPVIASPVKVSKVKSIKVRKKGKKNARISWKKIKGVSGYKVYMKTGKKGKFKLVKTIKKNKASYIKKKLKKGKRYYFKVRAYKKENGKTYYGKYSKTKKIKR